MFVDRINGVITASYNSQQYNGQEQIADKAPELAAFFAAIANASAPLSYRALQNRRAAQLAGSATPSDQLEAVNIRLQLLGG